MKASPQAQLKLLELAELDTELGRLDHRRRTLPENAEFEAAQQRDTELRDELAALEARDSDLTRDQAKAERDVDQVRSRIERDRARLDAGQVSSPKELENLQSEIVSLERRQGDLEEVVLEVMEQAEDVTRRRDLAQRGAGGAGRPADEIAARRDAAFAEIDEQAGKARDRRAAIAADLPGGPARSLRPAARPARRGRRGAAQRPVRRLSPVAQHGRPRAHPRRAAGRGDQVRGMPPHPGRASRTHDAGGCSSRRTAARAGTRGRPDTVRSCGTPPPARYSPR